MLGLRCPAYVVTSTDWTPFHLHTIARIRIYLTLPQMGYSHHQQAILVDGKENALTNA